MTMDKHTLPYDYTVMIKNVESKPLEKDMNELLLTFFTKDYLFIQNESEGKIKRLYFGREIRFYILF